MKPLLEIDNLTLKIADRAILKNLSLKVNPGEIQAIMGPNGSGKSSLASIITGHPDYQAYEGQIKYLGKAIDNLPPEERAQKGIFLSFQHPLSIPGVTVSNILRSSLNAVRKVQKEKAISVTEFYQSTRPILTKLKLKPSLFARTFNEGFSGGEKKKLEVLQLLLLKPKLAIFDEIDSGLDVDALAIIAKGINSLKSPNRSAIIITHYNRILKLIKPDIVHILKSGKLVKTGDYRLAYEVEKGGYGQF